MGVPDCWLWAHVWPDDLWGGVLLGTKRERAGGGRGKHCSDLASSSGRIVHVGIGRGGAISHVRSDHGRQGVLLGRKRVRSTG